MSPFWLVWEMRKGGWVAVDEWRHKRDAVDYASRRRLMFYRPVCVAPIGVDPEVAYPEAAR